MTLLVCLSLNYLLIYEAEVKLLVKVGMPHLLKWMLPIGSSRQLKRNRPVPSVGACATPHLVRKSALYHRAALRSTEIHSPGECAIECTLIIRACNEW